MIELHPTLVVGMGPQSRQAVARYGQLARGRQGPVPALLTATVELEGATSKRESGEAQVLSLPRPVYPPDADWPDWLPTELARMSAAERMQTRAWMRAALVQGADEIEEFLLERIPHLISFAAIDEMRAAGLSLAGDSEIRIYVIADLGDPLGSSVFVDVAYLAHHVCRQLGLQPAVSGVLYLPPATSPAPAEEAIAYAALKELDHYVQRRAYDREWVPDWAPSEDLAPFEGGCYLVDTVNELGYALEDPAQQVTATAEWLYAMTFLDVHGAARARQRRRYATSTLRGRARAYAGTGIAVRTVPGASLLKWMTAMWRGAVARRMLGAPGGRDGTGRARAFAVRTRLDLAELHQALRERASERQIERELERVRRAPYGQIELRARQALQAIRERHLPTLETRLAQVGREMEATLQQALQDEIAATEEEGLESIVQEREGFLAGIAERAGAIQGHVERLERGHGQALRAALTTVSEAHYALRTVVMSIPPWPIAVASVICLLLLPLIYTTRLIHVVLGPISAGWRVAAQVVLGLGVSGIAAFLGYQLWRKKGRVSTQYEDMVRERFELESSPPIYRAIRGICAAVQERVEEAQAELPALASALRSVTAQAERDAARAAAELEALTAPGPFRSVVEPSTAAGVWARVEGDLAEMLQRLPAEMGPIAGWQERAAETVQPLSAWLSERLARLGPAHLEPYVAACEALALTASRRDTPPGEAMRQLFESARPLWNYDPRALGRGKTERITVVAASAGPAARERLARALGREGRGIAWVDTQDPHSLVIVRIHRGLPLFALRRIDEYRTHYAEALWQGKRPLHTTCAMRLNEDLFPRYRGVSYPTAVLFATGLALGHIRRDPSGRYLAPRASGSTIALSRTKDRSVALMGMDGATCREVQRQLDAVLESKGRSAVHTILDEYVTVMPDLKDWEVRAILAFQR